LSVKTGSEIAVSGDGTCTNVSVHFKVQCSVAQQVKTDLNHA